MNTAEVETLVHDVIVHNGLPFTVVSVIEAPRGWTVQVLGGTGRTVNFAVSSDRPIAMRIAIQERLEAQM